MRRNPKVTVLMPVFNRERFVGEAIRSVLEQDFDDLELLLVDDGSTDRTPEVLETWKQRDPRVVVITSPANQGISAALNAGLAHARGRYVARLDSDDLMTPPHRLATQAAVLDADPEVVLVSCAFDIVDLAGNHLRTWNESGPREVTAFLLHFVNVVGHGTVMFRLADVLEAGGYRQGLSCEDYDLWVRLMRRGWIEMLPLVGMTKRLHPISAPWDFRCASWSGVMRPALESYLRRTVSDGEIAALITVWRHDRANGRAGIADGVMREAFECFRKQVPDRALQAFLRRRIARQWYIAARYIARREPLEAMKYLAHAARWLLTPRATATA